MDLLSRGKGGGPGGPGGWKGRKGSFLTEGGSCAGNTPVSYPEI